MQFEEIITGKVKCHVRGALLVGRSERSVDRFLADLKEREKIELHRMLAPSISDTRPIHIHVPGMDAPDFDAIAYWAEKRSKIEVGTEIFITATKALKDHWGGCFHGKVRPTDAAHAARQAWVFASLTAEEQAAWVPEERLALDCEHRPDAAIGEVLVEIIGRYPAAKMRERHEAWKHLTTYRLY